MAIGDKVGYETAQEIIRYLKNTLGINKDMKKYIQMIIRTFGERMDAQGQELFRNLERALATFAAADQWLSDPLLKSQIIALLEKLNRFPDDPEIREILKFTKEILQSIQDGLGWNDGEFMKNLSGALKTVADFSGIVNIIRAYLNPTSIAYFGVAGPIAAKILTHILCHYSEKCTSPKVNEELNILKAQLNVHFGIARQMAGMYLIGRVQINLQREILRALSPNNDALQLQNEQFLEQMERESVRHLEHIAPYSLEFLRVIQGLQLRIENEIKADKRLLELNPTDLLDRINCFTHGDVLLEGLYENNLTANLVSNRSSLTWKYLSCIYEQDCKLVIVQRQLSSEIKKSIDKLFDIITKTQIYTQFSLWKALAVIYNEDYNLEFDFPAISSELAIVHRRYHEELNEVHVRDLLRNVEYTRLREDDGMYDLLMNLLRKRAFFEVSHQLFCSLRFPNNFLMEVKIGALDVYDTVRHPIDTIKNLAYAPIQFLRHPIETPCQIGAFLWNRPMRVLTSAAINGAIAGGISAISKLSTATTVASNAENFSGFHFLTTEGTKVQPMYARAGVRFINTVGLESQPMYARALTADFKNVATSSSLIDSSLSTTILAQTTLGIMSSEITNLSQGDSKRDEKLPRNYSIADIFQKEESRLRAMNAETYFKTIDQIILDNEYELKNIVSLQAIITELKKKS